MSSHLETWTGIGSTLDVNEDLGKSESCLSVGLAGGELTRDDAERPTAERFRGAAPGMETFPAGVAVL
jgi:hypothetical protein